MTENTNKPSRPNNRNNNRKRPPSANKKRPNNNNNNRNRRNKALSPSRILQKYDNLMEQYIVARKKFFEMFGKDAKKQVEKVERNYNTALKSLRDFEVNLKEDWQKKVLEEKIDAYPADRQYSESREIEPKGDIVAFTGTFEDPHLLPTQKAEAWADDTEESEGTIEDYQKYKGQ